LRRGRAVLLPQPTPTTLGGRIKAIRTAWDWSQLHLGQTLGLDQALVSFWELDGINPGGASMVALSAFFRCSMETLESGEGFVIPDPPSRLPPTSPRALRTLSLPLRDRETTVVVDLMDGTAKGKDLPQGHHGSGGGVEGRSEDLGDHRIVVCKLRRGRVWELPAH
jgi:transcriptional regulator with XRE-family HTH domain